MPELTEWLKQLITVLILVGFMQFLLPENELKGAVKLTMGLFIITLLMQPLGRIIKMPEQLMTLNPPGFQHTANRGPTTERLIREGVRLRISWGKEFDARQQAMIKDKIKSLLGIIGDFKVDRLNVSFREADITQVTVNASPQGWRRDSAQQAELTAQIQNAVRLVTDLTENHIEVIWHGAR